VIKRFVNIIKGFLGIFLSGVEKNNPEALLQVEMEGLRKHTADFNQALAQQAGLLESLVTRSKSLETEEKSLTQKVESVLRAGKRELASQLALKLQNVTVELADVREQLAGCETQYKELTRSRDVSVQAAKQRIESISRGINDMKLKKAAAEVTEMANGMISNLGAGGDNLNRIEAMVNEERSKAAGRIRVAKDATDVSSLEANEGLQQDLAEIALLDFEAKFGLSPKVEGNEKVEKPVLKSMSVN
jgi:phage shock protein A